MVRVASQRTGSPWASQSGFSQTKVVSMTLAGSAGRAVTPQAEQIGARSSSSASASQSITATSLPVDVSDANRLIAVDQLHRLEVAVVDLGGGQGVGASPTFPGG